MDMKVCKNERLRKKLTLWKKEKVKCENSKKKKEKKT